MTTKGAFLAAAVAGLFSAVAGAPSAHAADKNDKAGGEVMCEGVNGCKGKGACASAHNACAGKNGCKGQGVMKTTKADCEKKGGKVQADKKG